MPLPYAEQYRQAASSVEQSRQQLVMDRMRLSKSLAELVNFTQQNISDDVLIYPIKENPFKPPSRFPHGCRLF